jgi:hypothetical protein
MGKSNAILVVFPDEIERRSPLLFSIALVMDAIAQIEARDVGRRILYFSSYAGIRSQLASVRLGKLALDGVFSQHYGRGRVDKLTTLSEPGGINLPSVLCIYAPADPGTLLRQYKPCWVSVDCGEAQEIPWLPPLLIAAKKMNVPVVGWTGQPLSEVVTHWLANGGSLFRWPRLRVGIGRISNLEQLVKEALEVEVTPQVLLGEHVVEISKAFATATESLLAASGLQDGRLTTDAVMLGWRYLRALESVPVPLEVYEREADSYWGIRRVADLREAFIRFVEAVHGASPRLHTVLQVAADALLDAHERLAKGESPLWLGLSNLCIDSNCQRRILFSSKARKDMFSFSLLAKFNISEDDLKDIGVQLGYLTERADGDACLLGIKTRPAPVPGVSWPLLVGLPSRFAERRIEAFLQTGRIEILLWPHQVSVLERRLRLLSAELCFAARRLDGLSPSLEDAAGQSSDEKIGRRVLRMGRSRNVTAGVLNDELRKKAEAVSLWQRPDATEAVASLLGLVPAADDESTNEAHNLLDESVAEKVGPLATDDPWVQDAVEIHLEGGQHVLLPMEETVNVIVHNPKGIEVEQRYVRSLRRGDEILFIQGQRRQSLYELLVSRVHRDPVIAQYLALVRRWQDDFVRAFTAAERQGRFSAEQLLENLRARGSEITSSCTIRSWLRRLVLAPHDAEDLKRIAEVFSLGFVKSYYLQIHKAGRRLKGLHINLSVRLNRWLASGEAGAAASGAPGDVIDEELGLTVEDFRHSLLRLRVLEVKQQRGPFYRPHMGHLEGGSS